MFDTREQAGLLLAKELSGLPLLRPLVLAIPRGGIDVGLSIARGLNAELDVVLARKLRCPTQPEFAIGAVNETGDVFLDRFGAAAAALSDAEIERERQFQLGEIARRRQLYLSVRPKAEVAGRSVILTDDGIATGSTMIAAIRSVRAGRPHEIIVAVPVAAPQRATEIAQICDRLVCLLQPEDFQAVGQFYRSFDQVSDERVVALFQASGSPHAAEADV